MTKKIIVANWKSLPDTRAQAEDIMAKLEEYVRGLGTTPDIDIVICPPHMYIGPVAQLLGDGSLVEVASLGVQDINVTGDGVQAGARYVIIGHSDRRWKLGESGEVVNAKLKSALQSGLVPIVCLGERSRQGEWKDELAAQVRSTFAGLTAGQVGQCLIAYEPVWAISTNPDARPDTPASAVQSMGIIRDVLADSFDVSVSTFLYGGSVNPGNAREFLERPEIVGVLVGRASVNPEEFIQIIQCAQ